MTSDQYGLAAYLMGLPIDSDPVIITLAAFNAQLRDVRRPADVLAVRVLSIQRWPEGFALSVTGILERAARLHGASGAMPFAITEQFLRLAASDFEPAVSV
jgi:hypothetical protein